MFLSLRMGTPSVCAIIGPMGRVVLIIPSATYRATDFMAAAEILDVELIVASDRRPTLEAVMGDRSQVIRFDHPEESAARLVELHDRLAFDAVLGVDDQGVVIAALTAERLGLPHSPSSAVVLTRDKAALRRRLESAGMRQPSFATIQAHDDVVSAVAGVGLPCVVKPLSLSASRGVIRVDTVVGGVGAVERVRALVAAATGEDHADVLVEGYIPGDEVAVEALAEGGRATVLAIFDKPDPLEGPFFEETIYVTPSRLAPHLQRAVAEELQRAVFILGLSEGPIHAEFRIDGERVVLLEMAGRSIGGLCSRALRFGAGTTLEELILRHALGLGVTDSPSRGASGVMMIPIPGAGTLHRVEGADAARRVPSIRGLEITIPVGEKVVPLPEGDRYLGFIFAAGDAPAEVEDALRRAHALLEITIEPPV